MMKILKSQSIFLIALLAGLFSFTGCEEIENKLIVNEGETCVLLNGKKTCYSTKAGIYFRLYASGNKVYQQAIKTKIAPKEESFLQYGKPRELPYGTYKIAIRERKLVLIADQSSFDSGLSIGFILGGPYQTVIMSQNNFENPCVLRSINIVNGSIQRGQSMLGTSVKIYSTILTNEKDSMVMINKVVTAAANSRTMANDTGTEIVITDEFKLAAAMCCETEFPECCLPGEVNEEEMQEPDASLQGQIIPVGSVCIFEDCTHILVVDCRTGKVTCYDTMGCAINIRVLGGYVAISTSKDCRKNNVHACG